MNTQWSLTQGEANVKGFILFAATPKMKNIVKNHPNVGIYGTHGVSGINRFIGPFDVGVFVFISVHISTLRRTIEPSLGCRNMATSSVF